jgi:uncharacterized membrane protein (DUF485 family)
MVSFMSTDTPAAAPGDDRGVAVEPGDRVAEIANSEDFAQLRRSMRRFVVPMTAAFLGWYGLYVLMSAYARDFMTTKVAGNVNVALVFGLLQFVSTFLIAWLYARFADRHLDPVAERLRLRLAADPAATEATPTTPTNPTPPTATSGKAAK